MARVERLEIPRAKIEDYLLNLEHADGWSKAKFFLARGFQRDRSDIMAQALASQAMSNWPGRTASAFGVMKHAVTGPIACPDGTAPVILTVWQVREGSATASFVTARPQRPKPQHPRN